MDFNSESPTVKENQEEATVESPSLLPPSKPWYKKPLVIIVASFIALWFSLPFLVQLFGLDKDSLPANINSPAIAAKVNLATTDDPSLGPSTAPITVVEFGDFECPFCKAAAPIFKQVLAKYPEAIRLIYRDFPLIEVHKNSIPAAEAANCAASQGKFWEYHDLIFERQAELGPALYDSLARSLGLDIDKFNRCRDGHLTLPEIQADYEAGAQAGVTATPTWFINSYKVQGVLSVEDWDKIILSLFKAKFK